MISTILAIFWTFIPAGIANMSPVLFKRVDFLNYPVSKKLLGDHKTWRGLFFGILMATIIVFIQKNMFSNIPFKLLDYSAINPLILGPVFGAGALVGDMVKSFFKRRVGIQPGRSWIPFDQIDWIVGANLLLLTYTNIGIEKIIISIVLMGVLHPLVNFLSYCLKCQKVKI